MEKEALLRERKNRIKRLILVSAAMFSVALALGTFAWFASSKSVEGDGMNVSLQDGSFELMVQGEGGLFDDLLPEEYATSDSSPFRTDTQLRGIQWFVSETAHIGNYDTGEEDAYDGISPGSKGQLDFWVIPANTETLNLQFTLDLTGFRNDVDSPDSYDELTALDENDADYTTLTNLLDGHILFFREKDADGNYSGLIDDTFTENIQFTKDQSGELDPYPMTIYWVWPNTFEEAMLTDADLNGEQKSICNSTELLDKFAEDPDHFLYGYEVPNDATLDASYVREQKTLLSRAYNDADQEIGDEVGYLLVELTALEIH